MYNGNKNSDIISDIYLHTRPESPMDICMGHDIPVNYRFSGNDEKNSNRSQIYKVIK